MVYVGVSEPGKGSRGPQGARRSGMNFDSARRQRRFERSKSARQRRNQQRWASLKQIRERQRQVDRMIGLGVIG